MPTEPNEIPTHGGLQTNRATTRLCAEALKIYLRDAGVDTSELNVEVSNEVPGETTVRVGWVHKDHRGDEMRAKFQADKAVKILKRDVPSPDIDGEALIFKSPRMLAVTLNGMAKRLDKPDQENTTMRDFTALNDAILGRGASRV